MLGSNHSTFYIVSSIVPIQIFCIKNVNPSFYAKHVENAYFPLPFKFELMRLLRPWTANFILRGFENLCKENYDKIVQEEHHKCMWKTFFKPIDSTEGLMSWILLA
jgi:hypothetical protein